MHRFKQHFFEIVTNVSEDEEPLRFRKKKTLFWKRWRVFCFTRALWRQKHFRILRGALRLHNGKQQQQQKKQQKNQL